MVSTLSPYPSLIFKEFRNYFVFQKLFHILWLLPLLIKPFSCLAEAMYIESLRIQNSGGFLFTKRKCSFFPCISFICLIYLFVFSFFSCSYGLVFLATGRDFYSTWMWKSLLTHSQLSTKPPLSSVHVGGAGSLCVAGDVSTRWESRVHCLGNQFPWLTSWASLYKFHCLLKIIVLPKREVDEVMGIICMLILLLLTRK